MKKLIRIISVVVSAMIVAALLCSCIPLDDLRERRCFFTDESKEAFVFKDHTYRLIHINGDMMIQNELYNGVVTTEDIPLLLSERYGYRICYNMDEEIPTVIRMPYYYDSKHDNGTYYHEKEDLAAYFCMNTKYAAYFCLDTKYDEVKHISDNAQFDSMYIGYNKEVYVDDVKDYRYVQELIPSDYRDAIDRVLSSNQPVSLSFTDITGGYQMMNVNLCDRNMLIAKPNSTIEIICYHDEFYISSGENYYGYNYVLVPQEFKELFKKYFREYDEKGAVYYTQHER